MHYKDFVFLDTETTGSNPARDRITEVGLYVINQGEKQVAWSHLLNPETTIPAFIKNLTGISNEMVADKPVFSEIACELAAILHDKILVAHNARFDYGFLKNEFKRCQIDLREKMLCTVKLSRLLFPFEKRHSLDAIKARFNLIADGRHRALADVELMYQFFKIAQNQLAEESFNEIIHTLIKSPSLPILIPQEELDAIPHTAGVYKFYDEMDQLIYVGKSVSLRDRVLSHFSADHSSYKEMRLAQQVKRVDWIETVGEFGALLMEALMVKEEMPVHNRRLRRHKSLFTLKLQMNQNYNQFNVVPFDQVENLSSKLYGIFRTKREALKKLQNLTIEHRLCPKLMGLEKAKGSCFNYQLKKCLGACAGVEDSAIYNLRVQMAVKSMQYKAWPFAGRIALLEVCPITERRAYHVFDQWFYLGTQKTEADLFDLDSTKPCFDIDVYKLLQKSLSLFEKRQALIKIFH